MKIILFLLSMVPALFLVNEKIAEENSDLQAVEATLNNYIYGRNDGDIERLRKAFHPTASLKFVNQENGELKVWSSADYVSNQKPGVKKNCTGKIESVRIFQDAAQATVIINYPQATYYDFMSLLKIKGKWVIIDKIFAKETVMVN